MAPSLHKVFFLTISGIVAVAQVACSNTKLDGQVKMLPKYDRVFDVSRNVERDCKSHVAYTPHAVWIYSLVPMKSNEQADDIVRWFSPETAQPGADGMSGRVPDVLLEATDSKDLFDGTDCYWSVNNEALEAAGITQIQGAESSRRKLLYVEYLIER